VLYMRRSRVHRDVELGALGQCTRQEPAVLTPEKLAPEWPSRAEIGQPPGLVGGWSNGRRRCGFALEALRTIHGGEKCARR